MTAEIAGCMTSRVEGALVVLVNVVDSGLWKQGVAGMFGWDVRVAGVIAELTVVLSSIKKKARKYMLIIMTDGNALGRSIKQNPCVIMENQERLYNGFGRYDILTLTSFGGCQDHWHDGHTCTCDCGRD